MLTGEMMLTASITDTLGEAGVNFISWIMDIYNAALEIVYTLICVNPTTGTYEETWETVTTLYNSFFLIGSSLVVLFFLYGYCRDAVDIKAELQFETTVKLFIRLIITINLMHAFIGLLPRLFSWAIIMLGITHTEASELDSTGIGETILQESGPIVVFFIGVVLFLVVTACSVMIIWSATGRFINLYILIPFAAIALSTLAGGGQLAQTGYSYIKTILALTFEIVAMGVVLAVVGAFLSGSVVASENGGALLIVVEIIVKVVTVTAAFKGCDATIKKAFNL